MTLAKERGSLICVDEFLRFESAIDTVFHFSEFGEFLFDLVANWPLPIETIY